MSSLDKNTNQVIERMAKMLSGIILYFPLGFINPIARGTDKVYYYLRLKNLTKTYHSLEDIPEENKFCTQSVLNLYEKIFSTLVIGFHFLLYPALLGAEKLRLVNVFSFKVEEQAWYQVWLQSCLEWLKNNPGKIAYFIVLPIILGPTIAVAFGIKNLTDAYLFYTCSIWSGLILNTLANFITQAWRASEWLDLKKFMTELGSTMQSESDWNRYTKFITIYSLNLSFDLIAFNYMDRLRDWTAGCTQYFKEWLGFYLVVKVSANYTPDLMLKLESYLELDEEELLPNQAHPANSLEMCSMPLVLGRGLWLTSYHYLHSLGSNGAIDYYHQQQRASRLGVNVNEALVPPEKLSLGFA
tara:strand:- start:9489 stop:10556 length:1068 start_codon:yes stop_codon:yes gene_type:complete